MKKLERENIINLPYSLHDSKINNIEVIRDKVTLKFNNGYYKIPDDYLIHGHLEFTNVDLDYCSISIFDFKNNFEEFSGMRYTLQDFSKNFNDITLEIIDETYGYNKSKFSGFMYDNNITKEFILEIYHFDNMKYIAEE